MVRGVKKPDPADVPDLSGGANSRAAAAARLLGFLEAVEKVQHEMEGLKETIREIFAEAKAEGWDVPTMRSILKLRKMDPEEREERENMLTLYMHALGMIPEDLPAVRAEPEEEEEEDDEEDADSVL